jgi:hypothetical protein
MKKQIFTAVGILFTLGTAVSASLNEEAPSAKPSVTMESAAAQMGAKQSTQIVALWKTHAGTSGSVPLARPL